MNFLNGSELPGPKGQDCGSMPEIYPHNERKVIPPCG